MHEKVDLNDICKSLLTKGFTALDLASDNGFTGIATLLTSCPAGRYQSDFGKP
jgi:hypothetical protein